MLHAEILRLKVLFVFILFTNSQDSNFTTTRHKRYLPLIFRNPAAITYITGFGIPVHNLNPELVTVGMVFKAQQFLPTTYAALRHQANHSIHKRQTAGGSIMDDNSRAIFYRALEQLSISLGQTGHSCVLKMICEVASTPFHYQNGVLGEIVHILLTPSSSLETNLDTSYLQAEHNGRSHNKCAKLYTNCHESILDRITNLFD